MYARACDKISLVQCKTNATAMMEAMRSISFIGKTGNLVRLDEDEDLIPGSVAFRNYYLQPSVCSFCGCCFVVQVKSKAPLRLNGQSLNHGGRMSSNTVGFFRDDEFIPGNTVVWPGNTTIRPTSACVCVHACMRTCVHARVCV